MDLRLRGKRRWPAAAATVALLAAAGTWTAAADDDPPPVTRTDATLSTAPGIRIDTSYFTT
ncbi:hypothetical protein NGM37_02715, partial [Streptomyces sp. TRM76130]|nr:hypothetical protein [Streptomyces sp. TRM76130]